MTLGKEMQMAKGAVLDQYKHHQQQMSAKHIGNQWEHPNKNKKINSKEEYYSKISKLKKPEDIEAILAIEDELWNS
jgi:hypothetical protein